MKAITFERRPKLASSAEEEERLRVLLEENGTGLWGTR